jgi:RNA:NAD 2'-phosphotransferase (TPT1/KptA family)/8-oxo-dGTP pyrophosphatase MutT (NUDIX family)
LAALLSRFDPVRLSKAMTFLLHQPTPGTPLRPDMDGWVELRMLTVALADLLGLDMVVADVHQFVQSASVRRFEIMGTRIRSLHKPRRARIPPVPDILFHATTQQRLAEIHETGWLRHGGDRPVFFSTTEAQAWRAAHRFRSGTPLVLYIDASRARRRGARFHKHRRNGLFATPTVAIEHILNLSNNFAHQFAAGGMPIAMFPDGRVRMALVRVGRRSGVTWEVAKGKLETGEVPERAAVREVQEEMGVTADMRVVHHLGDIRYGFVAPGSLVRLKTVFLYLMIPTGPMHTFKPATREGISQVAWFTPDEAVDAVTHSSLIPQVHRARRILSDPSQVHAMFQGR